MIYRKATVTNILSSSDQVLYLGVKVLASYVKNNEIIISKNQQINAIAYYSVMDKVNIGDTLNSRAFTYCKKNWEPAVTLSL